MPTFLPRYRYLNPPERECGGNNLLGRLSCGSDLYHHGGGDRNHRLEVFYLKAANGE